MYSQIRYILKYYQIPNTEAIDSHYGGPRIATYSLPPYSPREHRFINFLPGDTFPEHMWTYFVSFYGIIDCLINKNFKVI